MPTDRAYVISAEGKNLKFKREALLNYAMNRWGLNKAASVDAVSELIRRCAPGVFEEWNEFYFQNAVQKKKNGIRITPDYLQELGRRLYVKLSEVVQSELQGITETECIDYVYNLVLNRTYEGYRTEIATVYGLLQKALGVPVEPAPDEWDRSYNVDFFINVETAHVGIQIKPISTKTSPSQYKWHSQLTIAHERFAEQFGGKVFIVYSVARGKAKEIQNPEVIEEIRDELECLRNQEP